MTRRILLTLLILTTLSACLPSIGNVPTPPHPDPVSTETPVSTPAPPNRNWWQDAIFYEIFVRSFYDTNNDGIGDFNGITAKLDYLQELGITAIWLMPIHPSPSYHGYDVVNYFAVNQEYGSMDDFKHLLEEAHKRDIRVVIDLVINHTSALHPFFIDANSNPNAPYRNWYIWSNEWQGNNWYQGYHGYYYAFLWDGMPDLNYNNPEVTVFMNRVTEYWLKDIGVDGFRVDAAKHLIEQDGQTENTPATHDWYKEYYATYKTNHPNAYTVGEVWGAGSSVVKSYTGNQLDQVFNFEMASGFVNSANGQANSGIISALQFAMQDMPDFNYATFLTNHDQNRTMSVFYRDMGKAKVAASLMLTSPGTPFIYYGEEIGMQGQKPDEDIRLPMQWSGDENAGFSGSKPWRSPGADYPEVNVAEQENDPDSLLSHYRDLISIRNEHSTIRSGDVYLLSTGNSGVFAMLRYDGNEATLVLINLKDEPIRDYGLTLGKAVLQNGSYTPEMLFGEGQAAALSVDSGKFENYRPLIELAPHTTLIIKLL